MADTRLSLSDYFLNTAVKTKKPVIVYTKSGNEYVGVIKQHDIPKNDFLLLWQATDVNKMYCTINVSDISCVMFADNKRVVVEDAEDDDSPTPF